MKNEAVKAANFGTKCASIAHRIDDKSNRSPVITVLVQYSCNCFRTHPRPRIDVWTIGDESYQTTITDQAALGYFKNLLTRNTARSGAYKKIKNRIDYIDGADPLPTEPSNKPFNGRTRIRAIEVIQ